VTQPIHALKISFEQRSRRRFPLRLAGVHFEIADRKPFAGSIDLMVSWPCVLDGACTLKLTMKGRAIQSSKHEFGTAGPASGAKRDDLKMPPAQS
jgi:hypothetical protein